MTWPPKVRLVMNVYVCVWGGGVSEWVDEWGQVSEWVGGWMSGGK
jgi:hypothetical protein